MVVTISGVGDDVRSFMPHIDPEPWRLPDSRRRHAASSPGAQASRRGNLHGRDDFGSTITLPTGRSIPVRWIGEQHVREDLGFIPSFADQRVRMVTGFEGAAAGDA